MTEPDVTSRPAQPGLEEPEGGTKKPRKGDYAVGRGRPPLHSQWQPGQSGNPGGRRRGRPNLKTELAEMMSTQVKVREGGKERKVSLPAANILAHGVQGAQGDVRSAGLFLNYARQMGLLEGPQEIESVTRGDAGARPPFAPAKHPRPSDRLFEHLDENLLSRDEQIELSRIAEVIDGTDGDITALSTADFERIKHIVNKGRGEGVTAH